MDAETGGGLIMIAAGFLPGGDNRLPLGIDHRRLQTVGRAAKVGGIENPLRKIFRKTAVCLAQNYRALDSIFEFADVARPGVAQEARFGPGRDFGNTASA